MPLPQFQRRSNERSASLRKFRRNPTAASINYRENSRCEDKRVRTVRIGIDYRAVILHPEAGDIHVLVWVDHHDEAMEWTRNRTFDINPTTGAIQIVDVDGVEQTLRSAKVPAAASLFGSVSDEVLVRFGVPAVLLPSVRALGSKKQLEDIQKHLPNEAAEALCWLAEGIPAEEIAELNRRPVTSTCREDRHARFEHRPSITRIRAPVCRYRLRSRPERCFECTPCEMAHFLHPSQVQIVARHFNGPACVLGCAGTGKSVVAMHRTRHLLKEVFTSGGDRILFTTFTANLARDIRANLQNLCGDEIERLDVMHLDSWAASYLRARGRVLDIATEAELSSCWTEAVSSFHDSRFSPGFLRQNGSKLFRLAMFQLLTSTYALPARGEVLHCLGTIE